LCNTTFLGGAREVELFADCNKVPNVLRVHRRAPLFSLCQKDEFKITTAHRAQGPQPSGHIEEAKTARLFKSRGPSGAGA
jgi:hypothetical protein